MSGVVEYLVSIKGMIDANIAKAMQGIGASAQQMASQVASAEGALGKLASAQANAATMTSRMGAQWQRTQADQQVAARRTGADITAMAASYETAAKAKSKLMAVTGSEYERAAALANNLDRANPGLYTGRKGAAMLEQHVAEQLKAQTAAAGGGSGRGGSGGFFAGGGGGGALSKAMHAYFALEIGKMGVHAVDHVIGRVGDVDAMRAKLRYSLGSTPEASDLADQAVAKAKEISGQYRNTTVLENLRIMDDLRANLPESFSQIIGEYAGTFSKLHSFLKTWRGGKHSGDIEKSLHDIDIAVRSGELGGNVTGAEMAKWAEMLAIQRAWYGEKFNLDQFFTAQKSARYSLPGTSDRFKMAVFPAMIQAMGPSAGVALATSFNKMVGGITMHQTTLDAWDRLGLVDRSKVKYGKGGHIDTKSVAGKDWVIGGDLYKTDPDLFVTRHLLPALAREGRVKALTPETAKQISEAYAANDAHALSKLLPPIVKDTNLMQALAPLGKTQNAVQNLYIMIERMASIARDVQGLEGIRTGKDAALDTYDKAKQEVSAQANRLLISATGKDFMGAINAAMAAVASMMGGAADVIEAHSANLKAARKQISDAIASGKTADEARAESGDTRGFWARVRDPEERRKAYNRFFYGDDSITDVPGLRVGSAAGFARQAMAADTYVGGSASGAGLMDAARAGAGAKPQSQAATAQAQRVQVESRVQVQTHFDPIQIAASSLTVTYNGPIGGSGSVPMSGSGGQPRGQAMPATSTAH